jgi:hypothetical protein
MDVIVFQANGRDEPTWAAQFVAASPRTRASIPMPAAATRAQVVTILRSAATRASRGGTVILLVGHGGAVAGDPMAGMVDLAPQRRFRLEELIVFYDTDPDGPGPAGSTERADTGVLSDFADAQRRHDAALVRGLANAVRQAHDNQALRRDYLAAGRALAGVQRVVFLACNVGRSTRFIDKIARDWGIEVQAYRRQVATTGNADGRHLFLMPDAVGRGTNVAPACLHEIPTADAYVGRP